MMKKLYGKNEVVKEKVLEPLGVRPDVLQVNQDGKFTRIFDVAVANPANLSSITDGSPTTEGVAASATETAKHTRYAPWRTLHQYSKSTVVPIVYEATGMPGEEVTNFFRSLVLDPEIQARCPSAKHTIAFYEKHLVVILARENAAILRTYRDKREVVRRSPR